MNRPIIGVSSNYRPHEGENGNFCLDRSYTDAIYKAGGFPQIIPILPKEEVNILLEMYDGILFTGGGGLLPEIEEMDVLPDLEKQNPDRYKFEANLIESALDKNMPMLGICRGHQMINDVCGGTVENLTTNKHRQQKPNTEGSHHIEIKRESNLFTAVNSETGFVNSLHSQVINQVGTGLKVNCYSDDGFIEGIESSRGDQFIMGVQFHPEFMIKEQSMLNIYVQFIKAAQSFKQIK